MTLTSEFFLRALDAAIAKRRMLDHPFYQLWNEGKLSKETLQEYAKQYYAHVRAFPTYVSAVHSHCDDLGARQMLLANLMEEEGGPNNHPELWLRFAEGLGVAREMVRSAEPLPSTVASVATLKSLTQSDDYLRGVAALYAYESQIPEVAKTKREGLKRFYSIDDERAVSFFAVHETADLEHREIERRLLASARQEDASRTEVIEAAEEAAKALWNFLDGVYETYAK
jgi:pyrroloquinoline-quinone synthase